MGGTNTDGGKNKKFYSLKTKASASDTPHFGLQEKVDGKWKITTTFNAMVGMLNAAYIKEKEWQSKKYNVFVFEVQDDKETSLIEMNHNSITYSFINSLAKGCNKLDTYKFEVWKKEAPTGGKYFANGAVKCIIAGQDVKQDWSLDPKATPQKEPVMHNGVQLEVKGDKVWSYDKMEKFWEQLFTDKVVPVLGAPVANNTPVSSATNQNSTSTTNEVDDGMPF